MGMPEGMPGRFVNESNADLWRGKRLHVIRKSKRLRKFFTSMGLTEKMVRHWNLDNPYMKPHARRTMLSQATQYREKR